MFRLFFICESLFFGCPILGLSEISSSVILTAISLSILAFFSSIYMDRLTVLQEEMERIASRERFSIYIVDCFRDPLSGNVSVAIYSDIDLIIREIYIGGSRLSTLSAYPDRVDAGNITIMLIDVSSLTLQPPATVKISLYSRYTGYVYLSCSV